jgi:hypothetical protein
MNKQQFLKSVLESIAEPVFTSKNLETARSIFVEHVSKTNVKDREIMLEAVAKLKTLNDMHRYLANALLKFEGMGIPTTSSKY